MHTLGIEATVLFYYVIARRRVAADNSCKVRHLSIPDTLGIEAAVLFSHVIARSEATWQSPDCPGSADTASLP